MRVLFCGSGKFAVPSLQAVARTGHELVGVITQPARPAGRGGKLRPTPLSDAASSAGLKVTECANINSEQSVSAIQALAPDVICVVDFGQLVRKPVRDSAGLGAFNLHGSLLPALRGAAPVNWAVIRGYHRTGATTFSLVDQMDAGPIYHQAETEIKPDETAEELRERISQLGAELVCKTLEQLAAGPVAGRKQDESLATPAPRMKKSDGVIEWSANAEVVRNLIHGAWPWPGGQAEFRRSGGRCLAVTIARAAAEKAEAAGEPGCIDEDLLVATGAGRLRIVEIKPSGKRLMAWKDFVNGYRVGKGDCFARPEASENV